MKTWSGIVITIGFVFGLLGFGYGTKEDFFLVAGSIMIAGGTIAMSISNLKNEPAEEDIKTQMKNRIRPSDF
jgi:hypothetical protein